MRRAPLACLLPVLCWLCVTVAPARAEALEANVQRFAVLIGNDLGGRTEVPLRYAESDALKLAGVLQQVGGFAAENIVVLRGGDAASAMRALIAINDRIRTRTGESLLLVYYSGHGDRSALHLGQSRLELEALNQLVRGSAATVRLLIVDACHSGALTRVKGGRRAPRMDIQLHQRLSGEGVVFLTSSSANEQAQESDELRSSFFTHYLTSGLLGAADQDQDGVVVLKEAYRHAYENTIRASSRTEAGIQHPTFRYELGGQGDIALSQLVSAGGTSVRFPPGFAFLLLKGSREGAVVAEVSVRDRARLIHVKPGAHFVRGRGSDHLLEGVLQVRPGESALVDVSQLERIDYARMIRRGDSSSRHVYSPAVGYQLRSAIVSGASPCHGPLVAMSEEGRELRWTARLGACRGHFENANLSANTDELSLVAHAARVWDAPVLSFDLGAGLGVGLLRESFDSRVVAPVRTTFAASLEVGGSVIRYLPGGIFLSLHVAGAGYSFPSRSSSGEEALVVRFAARSALQLGWQFMSL